MVKNLATDEKISTVVQFIADRWRLADKTILRNTFPLLAEGRPVTVERIAASTGSHAAAIEQELGHGRVGRDTEGRVTELFGLQLDPTFHRVEVGGIVLFTCCALVSHMVPYLTGKGAEVESVDPVSRQLVRLTITKNGVESVNPTSSVAALVVVDPESAKADARSNFCEHVHHFASRESAHQFGGKIKRRFTVEIEQLHAIAKELFCEIWAQPSGA